MLPLRVRASGCVTSASSSSGAACITSTMDSQGRGCSKANHRDYFSRNIIFFNTRAH